MNHRIRKLRKALDLTQQAFAEKIGLKQNSIALIESGKRNISDQAILSICREFNANEEWIRTGNGEMLNPKPTDALDQLAYQYKFSNAVYVMIEKFIDLRPDIQNGMVDYFREVIAALDEIDPYSPAYTNSEAPRPMDNFMKNQQKKRADAEAKYIKKISNSVPDAESTASNTTNGMDTQNDANEERASNQ